jgi:hypothetical protein
MTLATRDRVQGGSQGLAPPTPAAIAEVRAALDVYLRAYAGYLVHSVSVKPPEPNDLGDIELLLFVQPGRRLFTFEKKWLSIAATRDLVDWITKTP